MKKCPIQIIDEERGARPLRWIALLKDIDFEKCAYKNIIHFHPHEKVEAFNAIWVSSLFRGHEAAPIGNKDVIRNPTLEEMKLLEEIFIRTKSQINLRKQELVKCSIDFF